MLIKIRSYSHDDSPPSTSDIIQKCKRLNVKYLNDHSIAIKLAGVDSNILNGSNCLTQSTKDVPVYQSAQKAKFILSNGYNFKRDKITSSKIVSKPMRKISEEGANTLKKKSSVILSHSELRSKSTSKIVRIFYLRTKLYQEM